MLIIITGPSGVGKTTLAKKIAKKFKLPVIHKDEIKEMLFDSLGCKTLKQSKQYGKASWNLFYHFAEKQILNGNDLILEANFKPNFCKETFNTYKEKYKINIIQIRCFASVEKIVQRFRKRSITERHKGHNDHLLTNKDLERGIKEELYPLNINSTLIELDMNDFDLIDHEELFRKINELR